MRYPYEEDIEQLVQAHFNIHWSFDAARRLPSEIHSKQLLAIRDLVYAAMQKSFNNGIDFAKSGKRGMTPA